MPDKDVARARHLLASGMENNIFDSGWVRWNRQSCISGRGVFHGHVTMIQMLNTLSIAKVTSLRHKTHQTANTLSTVHITFCAGRGTGREGDEST